MIPSTPLSRCITNSPIGTLALIGSERGLREIHWAPNAQEAEAWIAAHYPDALNVEGFFASTVQAIHRYLEEGEPLQLPYDLVGGTALQRMVWLAIAKIPYGETISYTALAERVGFPRAVRAVASACGSNPLPLVIPCHRIISKDGTLGGFSLGGLEVKEKLHALEKEARLKRVA